MRNKLNKGFTLIELLVVVAIIGILAAVGVVAYNGYTKAAKINSTKSIHANIVKYVASELTKCSLDSGSEIFDQSTVACNASTDDIVALLVGEDSPLQDKDPYDGGQAAAAASDNGNVVITASGDEINFSTAVGDDDETTLTAKVVCESCGDSDATSDDDDDDTTDTTTTTN